MSPPRKDTQTGYHTRHSEPQPDVTCSPVESEGRPPVYAIGSAVRRGKPAASNATRPPTQIARRGAPGDDAIFAIVRLLARQAARDEFARAELARRRRPQTTKAKNGDPT